jgi:hypothetical protein
MATTSIRVRRLGGGHRVVLRVEQATDGLQVCELPLDVGDVEIDKDALTLLLAGYLTHMSTRRASVPTPLSA